MWRRSFRASHGIRGKRERKGSLIVENVELENERKRAPYEVLATGGHFVGRYETREEAEIVASLSEGTVRMHVGAGWLMNLPPMPLGIVPRQNRF